MLSNQTAGYKVKFIRIHIKNEIELSELTGIQFTLCLLVTFSCLLITFATSLDPDQDRQNVGPDLDPNHLTLIVFLKDYLEKVNFEKKSRRQMEHEKSRSMES